MNWYVYKNDKEHGPFRSRDLMQLIQNGKVLPEDLVRPENETQWSKAKLLQLKKQDAGSNPVFNNTPSNNTEEVADLADIERQIAEALIAEQKTDEVPVPKQQVAKAPGKTNTQPYHTPITGDTPIERIINTILHDAVRSRASDIHVQPAADDLVVRFRIDGILDDAYRIPPAMRNEFINRLKVMGSMDIAERRKTQEGHAAIGVDGKMYDLRIALIPSDAGERITFRILARSSDFTGLDKFNLEKAELLRMRDLTRKDHGMFLVTGPTGSGKSTTLYAALQELNDGSKNILTVEDPIEYRIEGVSQIQVDRKKNLTFASSLRNFLRQDPDIVMVGEIRDAETAQIAVQASLTGHLVLSTLHTNDAVGAVIRLKDLGIEPQLLADSLLGVLAQRLTRQNCPECSLPMPLSEDDFIRLGIPPTTTGNFMSGLGCEHCRNTGYRGRIGLYELLTVNSDVRNLILENAKASDVVKAAKSNGMRLLKEDGIRHIIAGDTTVDEVMRVAAT